MFLQWCRDELVLSFIFVQPFCFVGQDAALRRHHCRNTNVGSYSIGTMRSLSRIIFGDYFKYEKTFDSNVKDSTQKLQRLLTINGVKGFIDLTNIDLTWDERSKKFSFLGKLTEEEGKTKLTGEFVLGTFHTIRYLIWFSFWTAGYILWEFGRIEFYKEGDEIGFLAFITLGLFMFIIFLFRTNRKVKEISETIDNL